MFNLALIYMTTVLQIGKNIFPFFARLYATLNVQPTVITDKCHDNYEV